MMFCFDLFYLQEFSTQNIMFGKYRHLAASDFYRGRFCKLGHNLCLLH